MKQLPKILVSLIFLLVFIVGLDSIEDYVAPNSDTVIPEHLAASNRYGEEIEGIEKDVDSHAYALSTPEMDVVAELPPDVAFDSDWILIVDDRHRGDLGSDAVFYNREMRTVLEPGAVAALGAGLIGLFAILRQRLGK